MKMPGGVAAAIVCVGALAPTGCAFGGSPADGLRFQPPPGWQSVAWHFGLMQFWRAPSDERQVLMLFKSPTPLMARDVFSPDRMQDTLKDVRVMQRRAIKICGDQPATYLRARGSSAKGGDDAVDMVTTAVGGTSYFAMYVRPVTALPDAEAEASLRQLCRKP